MILGLQGRTVAATTLLRPAFESIISGVFYHHLAQNKYRQSADYLRRIYKSAKGEPLLDIVEELVEEIEHNRLAQELEFKLLNRWLDSNFHIPTLKQMMQQIAHWNVLDNEGEDFMDALYHGLWNQLSVYSHSLLNRTYIGSGLQHTPMLELRANDKAIQDYTRLFRITCILVLLLLLASTEGLQDNPAFAKSMLKILRENPNIYDILGSIPNQIEDIISRQYQDGS